jgi:hypothetical protein
MKDDLLENDNSEGEGYMVGYKCPTEAQRNWVQKTYECLPLICRNITGIQKANFG